MTPIIGFTGPIGSGKDTLALMLGANKQARRLKFADPLYAMAASIDPKMHKDMLHKDKNGFLLDNPLLGTRRAFLEKLGTDFLRNCIHQDFFIMYMREQIKESMHVAPNLPITISDVRFENEAAAIRQAGGHIIHIKPTWECESTNHISGQGIKYDTGDSIVSSTWGKADKAYSQVIAIMQEVYSLSAPV